MNKIKEELRTFYVNSYKFYWEQDLVWLKHKLSKSPIEIKQYEVSYGKEFKSKARVVAGEILYRIVDFVGLCKIEIVSIPHDGKKWISLDPIDHFLLSERFYIEWNNNLGNLQRGVIQGFKLVDGYPKISIAKFPERKDLEKLTQDFLKDDIGTYSKYLQ